MTITDSINKILKINDSYKAPQRLMDLLTGDKTERDHVFKEMAYLFNHDYSFDWFHEYFQNEHADRKEKKQDFTPESVSKLLNRMVKDNPGSTMDVFKLFEEFHDFQSITSIYFLDVLVEVEFCRADHAILILSHDDLQRAC